MCWAKYVHMQDNKGELVSRHTVHLYQGIVLFLQYSCHKLGIYLQASSGTPLVNLNITIARGRSQEKNKA